MVAAAFGDVQVAGGHAVVSFPSTTAAAERAKAGVTVKHPDIEDIAAIEELREAVAAVVVAPSDGAAASGLSKVNMPVAPTPGRGFRLAG